MNYKEWTNPDKLLSWGFEKEEEHSTDSVRWVCYKKRIDIGTSDMYFEIVITYELTIHDSPTATYSENHYYFYEKTE